MLSFHQMETQEADTPAFLFVQWKLAEVCQILEHDLEIIGVTAIEDRLQV